MNRLANRVLKLAAVAAVCGFAAVGNAADWVRSTAGGWNVIVEQVETGVKPWILRIVDVPDDGETAIQLGLGHSTNNDAVSQYADHSEIDLTGTITSADGQTTYVITRVGQWALNNNTVTSFKMAPTLKRIGLAAFYGSTNLETFEPFFPDSLEYIEWAAFYNCSKLKGDFIVRNANFGMQTASSNDGIFYNCDAITSADFSESGLTVFGRCCFNGCDGLLSVKLPKSYAKFENAAAFYYTSKLREVSFQSFPNPISSDTFTGSMGAASGARVTYPGNNGDWDTLVRNSSFTAWEKASKAYQDKYNELWPEGPEPIGYFKIGPTEKWAVPIVEVVTDCRLSISGSDTSGKALNIGTVSPAYGDSQTVTEDSVVCTAGEFTTSGDYGYQCIGYKLGKLEGTQVVFGDMIAGHEYTFVKGEPGEYYLRWIWERQAAKVTVAEFPEEFGEVSVSGTNYHGYDGYYAYDAEVTFTATATNGSPFGSWCGDLLDEQRTRNPATVVMGTAPRTVTPYFSTKWVLDEAGTTLDDGYWTVPVSGDRDALTIKGATQKGSGTVLDFMKGIEDGGTFKTVQSSCLKTTPATDVLFPDSIETIGERVFESNGKVERIRLPSGLKRIEIATFWGCTSLKSVEPFLPKTLEYLGWAAFINCSSLTNDLLLCNRNLELQYGSSSDNNSPFYKCAFEHADLTRTRLTDLTRCFFYQCGKLKTIKLPKTLENLDRAAAFNLCTVLEDVQFQSYPGVASWPSDTFTGSLAMPNSRIVYPKGDPDWAAYIETRKQAKQFTTWEDAKTSDTNTYFETFKDGWKPIGYTSFSGINKWLVPHNFNKGTILLLN